MGSSVLGGVLGRKTISKTNVTKAAAAAKAAGRAYQQHGDVGQAGESLEVLRQKYDELEAKFQEEVDELDPILRAEVAELTTLPAGPGRRISPSSRSSWPGRRGRLGPRASRSRRGDSAINDSATRSRIDRGQCDVVQG